MNDSAKRSTFDKGHNRLIKGKPEDDMGATLPDVELGYQENPRRDPLRHALNSARRFKYTRGTHIIFFQIFKTTLTYCSYTIFMLRNLCLIPLNYQLLTVL